MLNFTENPRIILISEGQCPLAEENMLIEFRVGNFRSIREEQYLSMVASSDKTMMSHTIPTGARMDGKDLNLLRSVLIYGANASGKSNICKAFSAYHQFILGSATRMTLDDKISAYQPYRLSSRTVSEPSHFESSVLVDGVIYRYGYAVDSSSVQHEWLYSRKAILRAPEVLIFDRFGDNPSTWQFGNSFRGSRETLRSVRANCLLLSKGAQDNLGVFLPLFRWFQTKLKVANMDEPLSSVVREAAGAADGNDARGGSSTEIIQSVDWTVSDTQNFTMVEKQSQYRVNNSDPNSPWAIKRLRYPKVTFGRQIEETGDTERFDLEDESNGTKRFFAVSMLLLQAFREGFTLIIDELESSLHPLLIQEIMEALNDPILGQHHAQFLVATHDTHSLDVNRFRRDQIYLVEKAKSGASEFYSLSDFQPKPRSDAMLENQYLAGRFGGIPLLGSFRSAVANQLAATTPAIRDEVA